MPFFDGSTGPTYYRSWPHPHPRAALVFLHGFGEHTGLYHRYAAELGQQGVELWALDEIGHGLTVGERGHFGSLDDLVANARTLTELARAARPGLPLVVGGHSLGSLVAVLAALEDRAAYAGIVVSGALLSPLAWLAEATAAPDSELDLDPSALSADPFYLDQLETDPLTFTSGDVIELFSRAFPPAWTRLESELPGLGLPILAVQGERDEIAPLAGVIAWTDRLPDLEIEVVHGAAHDVLNEVAHSTVANRVATFVAERSGATAVSRG